MIGGIPNGHLHGYINPSVGTITGSNISYIYPDMETVLLGKFKLGKMQDAQESRVLQLSCDNNGLLYVHRYATPDPNSARFYYAPPSNISFGAGPIGVLDPYERKWLELRADDDQSIGYGVFTKRDLNPYTLVASYSGLVFGLKNGELELYNQRCTMNSSKSDSDRRHCIKYALGLKSRNAQINIPPEYDQSESVIPSLGPKVS